MFRTDLEHQWSPTMLADRHQVPTDKLIPRRTCVYEPQSWREQSELDALDHAKPEQEPPRPPMTARDGRLLLALVLGLPLLLVAVIAGIAALWP